MLGLNAAMAGVGDMQRLIAGTVGRKAPWTGQVKSAEGLLAF